MLTDPAPSCVVKYVQGRVVFLAIVTTKDEDLRCTGMNVGVSMCGGGSRGNADTTPPALEPHVPMKNPRKGLTEPRTQCSLPPLLTPPSNTFVSSFLTRLSTSVAVWFLSVGMPEMPCGFVHLIMATACPERAWPKMAAWFVCSWGRGVESKLPERAKKAGWAGLQAMHLCLNYRGKGQRSDRWVGRA